ncbi:MAG: ComF family protein [Chitinophagaceae bacterium]
MNALQHIGRSFTHLFFPQVCNGCGSDLVSNDQLLCLHCIHQLPYTSFQLHGGNPVEKIFWGRLPVMQAAGIFYLTKNSTLEKLLYQVKYRGKKEVGEYCGRLMGQAIQHSSFAEVDALIPLPLFPKKERQRGYNQAAALCEGIASIIHKPVLQQAVQRTMSTDTQTHKNRLERWANMQGRFHVPDAANVAGKHVLLVDDVITTGATLDACGNELAAAGATVSILTLGYAASRNV